MLISKVTYGADPKTVQPGAQRKSVLGEGVKETVSNTLAKRNSARPVPQF